MTLPHRHIGAPFPHRDPTRPSPTATPGLLRNPLGAFQHPSDTHSTPENPFLEWGIYIALEPPLHLGQHSLAQSPLRHPLETP